MSEEGKFELLSEVLEKMIDSQMANTQALTTLKNYQRETCETMKKIEEHFTDGFRSEIKNHISEQAMNNRKAIQKMTEAIEGLNRNVNSFKSFGFWFKLVTAFVIAQAAIVGGVSKVMDLL